MPPLKPATEACLPQEGQYVVFSQIPPGSYLSIGETYLVEGDHGSTLHFRNTKTGGGTFDRKSDIARAIWKLASRPSDLTAGDLYLAALNLDVASVLSAAADRHEQRTVAFSSGGGAAQVRDFGA